jgi:hypothetical protein
MKTDHGLAAQLIEIAQQMISVSPGIEEIIITGQLIPFTFIGPPELASIPTIPMLLAHGILHPLLPYTIRDLGITIQIDSDHIHLR